MAYSIDLVRATQQTGTSYGLLGFRMVVTATNGENIDNEIFRYIRLPVDPANSGAGVRDEFEGLCTPEELASLPLNNPDPEADPPKMRLDVLDVICRSEAEAMEMWIALQADVRELLNALKAMSILGPAETVSVSVS